MVDVAAKAVTQVTSLFYVVYHHPSLPVTTIKELKARGDALAMMISDQRMPGIQGTEVLTETRAIYPLARRVMLTAYSDIDAGLFDACGSAMSRMARACPAGW